MEVDRQMGVIPDSQNLELLHKIREEAMDNIKLARQKSAEYYNRGRSDTEYNIGDLVLLYTPQRRKGLTAKLLITYTGPFRITKKMSDNVFQIQISKQKEVVVNKARLQKFVSRIPSELDSEIQELPLPDLGNDTSVSQPARDEVDARLDATSADTHAPTGTAPVTSLPTSHTDLDSATTSLSIAHDRTVSTAQALPQVSDLQVPPTSTTPAKPRKIKPHQQTFPKTRRGRIIKVPERFQD
jgi:hypothetical protein